MSVRKIRAFIQNKTYTIKNYSLSRGRRDADLVYFGDMFHLPYGHTGSRPSPPTTTSTTH